MLPFLNFIDIIEIESTQILDNILLIKNDKEMLEAIQGGVTFTLLMIFIFYLEDADGWNKTIKKFFKKLKEGGRDEAL